MDIAGVYTAASEPVGAFGFDNPLTSGVTYSVIVIAAFMACCVMVFRFRGYLGTVFGIIRGNVALEKVYGEQNFVLDIFLSFLFLCGSLAVGVAAVKFIELYLNLPLNTLLPEWVVSLAPVMIWLVLYVVGGFQWIVLKCCGTLTRNDSFVDGLLRLRRLLMAMSIALLLPFLLLFSLARGEGSDIMSITIIIISAVLLTFYLLRTAQLFMMQKVSIFYWILYLCAVEIFPISLVVLLAARSICSY